MPDQRYEGRYAQIYLPSEKFLEKWKAQAEAAKMSLSAWIFAEVEAASEAMCEPVQEIESQKTSLQDENRRLRREQEKIEARMRELETEVFKLHNQLFAAKEPRGFGEFNEKLLTVLRSGGTWSGRDLLQELGVNQSDADAIQIVSNQLQTLQNFELVSENARGWKWVG